MSLLRSTKFVRYFTGAARTLILNSAKTAEANLLINPKALCAGNNVLLREYATSKKTESLEPLLQKLDSEVRRFGRIAKRDIDEVFDELRSKNDITSSQSLLIIRCCGELVPEELPEQRTLLVQKIWNVLTERKVPMDISHYNALLRVYIENEHPFSPAKLLEELEVKGLEPNRVTYQRLMWRYCQEGDVDGATKVLEKMRELNMPVSEPVLNALVMGHAYHGDTDGAKAVLETMAGAGLQPTNRTYTLLASGYAKQGDIDGVKNTFQTAVDKDIVLTDKDILDVIEHLAIGGHSNKVEELLPNLIKAPGYNQDACNLILKLLNKGHEDTAKTIMKTMTKIANSEDNAFKGAFFVKQLLKLNRPVQDVIKACGDLKQEGLVPHAFFIATEAALQHGQTELAQELFKELEKEGIEIRQHFYWPLLLQKGKEGDEEGLLQILRNMASRGIVPTGETLRDYVIPYLVGKDNEENAILKLQIANVPVIQSARNMMMELMEAGNMKKSAEIAVKYRLRGQYTQIARSLLTGLMKTKDVESFATILHVASSGTPTQVEEDGNDEAHNDEAARIDEVGRLVTSAVKSLNKPEYCEQILTAIHAKGLRISAVAAESIEQYLGQNLTTNLSELLAKLTSPDLEMAPLERQQRSKSGVPMNAARLETVLARAKANNHVSVNRLRKQLLLTYMNEKNVEKVKSFLEELKSSDFGITMSTLAQCYEFYCDNDRLEEANGIRAEMLARDAEFKFSKYKLVLMAYALVRQKKYDEAIQFLKEEHRKLDNENSHYALNSKIWQMLNTLAEQKESQKVKEMLEVLVNNEYAEPTNVLLGPLIKANLLKGDVDGAIKEFEFCCNNYRSTPWKGELMKALILKEDAAKLQWLADLSTQIHGEVNILHDLVLAFVECGRLRQARRILETPGLHTRQRRLEDACQRYVEEGKSEYLEGLLEATKELNHIDRSNIFYHLLVTYCKADQTDKALGLWTVLQEEGEVPSDAFLTHLGNHLKSKKRDVPFIIPGDTKEKTAKAQPKKQKVTPPSSSEPRLSKKQVSKQVEELVQNGNAAQGMDVAIDAIKKDVYPQNNVMKYMLKTLADQGNIEKIQLLGNHINANMKRNVTYDDKLTSAIFTRGAGSQHIDNVLESVEAANTKEDLLEALKKFPRSAALASIMQNEELVNKCHKIAEVAASKGQLMAANLLWMEYILIGKQKEADMLWKLWLNNANTLVFRRLLQESHVRKQPELIEQLIEALKTNQKISPGTLGNAFSRLINYYLLESKPNEALEVYEKAMKSGVTSQYINKSCIEKLKAAAQAAGKEIKFDS